MSKTKTTTNNLEPIILRNGGYESTLNNLRQRISESNSRIENFETDRNLKFTDIELKSLLTQNLNIPAILEKQNFRTLPPELRDIAKDGLRRALEKLNQHFAGFNVLIQGTRFLRDFVEVKNGNYEQIDNAEIELKELFILQINEPEKIEMYHEANQLAEQIMKLSERTGEIIGNIFVFDFFNNQITVNSESFANYSRY
ncbi:hypothetical protein [Kaistella carnis]|uniref:Uncharacterized protein n=1 Tax=Kaistella carnis TaxID=1241979 RepID=A0A3G8XKB5_9FLAO|nr:hypothetical protein [Kaistella carnis]AZI33955.1 hypothetical protein EIB73_12495 [Kaistella carnis]